jgi:flagellar assembly factor FliW
MTTLTAPAPMLDADEMIVASDLLGPLQVPQAALMTFPAGLLGFPEARRYVLVPAGREGLAWLQSADTPELVFLLADPFHWFPGYEIEVPSVGAVPLEVLTPDMIAVFAIVTLPATAGEQASANLRAPVVLDARTRTGRQTVLADDRYHVQTPFDLG